MGICEKHKKTKCPMPCPICLIEERDQLRAETKPLKEFARKMIEDVCWDLLEPDGGDMQEVAEKLGLIKSTKATEEDIDEESDFEVGDTIYKFTDILKDTE